MSVTPPRSPHPTGVKTIAIAKVGASYFTPLTGKDLSTIGGESNASYRRHLVTFKAPNFSCIDQVPQNQRAVPDILTAPYNDLEAVQSLLERFPEEIAAVIVEPIAANMGFVLPQPGFLDGLQELCRAHGALFILDEVMTGFRVAPGGAQDHWDLDPDITCLGKVIGGGLPVGSYAGKKSIMQIVAPAGPMYQAGTLSGNPLAMTAGLATLRTLLAPGVFAAISERTAGLVEGVTEAATAGIPIQVASAGTMFGFYFLKEEGTKIADFASAKEYANIERYDEFFHAMLDRGFYFAPSQFEAGFMSSAHTRANIEATITAVEDVFGNMV